MDNFRRPPRTKRGFAVDGILKSPKTPASGVGDFKRRPITTTSTKQTVGNFKQTEGFKATVQPSVPVSVSRKTPKVASEPPVKKKRGLFHRRKKDKLHKPVHRWRTLVKRTAIILFVLMFVGGGLVGAKAYMKSRKVLKGGGSAPSLQANVAPALLKGEGDGRINILLLGRGGAGHDGPDLTDTIIVASVDPVHHEAALMSIPRDLWIKPTGGYSYTKINSIYANAKYAVQNGKKIPNQQQAADQAGEDAIEKTIEDTFGIPIHYHVIVDFEAFRKAIDTVGGVDINVKTALVDPTVAWENNWKATIAPVGQNHMNGKTALLYARSRHGSARGDFDRSERQREIMIALKEKVFTLGTFSNPVKISQLLDAFGDHVQTNFGSSEVKRLYAIAKDIPSAKVTSVGLADPPNDYITTGMVNGQSVVIPKAGIGNYDAIKSYVRNTLKDSYLRDENASIVILNGTNKPGLATTRATELKSFGYNVTTVGDAPTKTYTQTLLIDRRSGAKKYTQHYLENRLGVKATTALPAGVDAGTADFVIVLGQ
jgi:LCP family protein required for cell wall assembly